ncbi:MAG: hypothetical protein AAB583_07010 [Patescibacteria group bacterium]
MSQKVKSQSPIKSGTKVKSNERGQVLLIVILVIIVLLTIGLSLASRGITNLRTSTEEADSQEALAAAEAEIEKALQNTVIGNFSGSFSPSTSYRTDVAGPTGHTFLLNGGSLITQGEGADVWLADHNPDGTINYSNTPGRSPQFFNLYWGVGNERDCNSGNPSTWPAAIEVIVVSGNPPNITTKRYAYDYCEGDRSNNFDGAHNANLNIGGTTFRIRTDNSIDITNGIFVRVIPIYKSAKIGIRACNSGGGNCTVLSPQGFQISSTGTTGTAQRKLNVFKGHQQIFLPYISYGLFVPTK